VVRTNTDITELHDRDAALSRSNADLRLFVHMASHDLHEPLRAMVSYSQLLARSEAVQMDPKTIGFLNSIVEAGEWPRCYATCSHMLMPARSGS
jgi:light-regulated signal transduction histidine kinase (bacteriophytochrome)